MKNILMKLRDLLSIIRFCLKMSVSPASKQFRKYFILSILLTMVLVALPFLLIYITSQIIGLLSSSFSVGSNYNGAVHHLLALCVAALAIGFCTKIAENFKMHCDIMYREVLNNHINVLMMEKTASLDVEFYDSPVFYNEMRDASNNIPLILQTAFQTFDFIRYFVQLIIAVLCLPGLNKIFALLIAAATIPNVIFQRKQFEAMYAWQRNVMSEQRKLNYLSDITFSKSFAKDAKLFNFFPFIREKYNRTWTALFSTRKKLSFRYTSLVVASTFLPELVMTLFMISLGIRVIGNVYTVGDYSYYFGVAGQVLTGAYLIIYNYGQIMDSKSRIENYLKFMAWENNVNDDGDIEFSDETVTMEFCNVSFRYDSSLPLVLKNVSFTIQTPNKTAFVGANGSGKSSVIKLMARFYDPDEGVILLNGIDLRKYTLKSVRKCFSTMFQDYPPYAFNVKESVFVSDWEKGEDTNNIYDALEKSGAHSFVSKFPDGINTYLTRQYDKNGIELSGGEWQKISAARTFFRDAPIMVLDEPSAALDAESEDELFKQLESKYAEKCAVLISHRLSNVTSADQILVLEKGEIIERGTHTELMARNGRYAKLFTLQAQKYNITATS